MLTMGTEKNKMTAIRRSSRSQSFLVFVVACSFQFILGFSSDDSPDSKNATKTEAHARSTTSLIIIILIVLVVFSLLSFYFLNCGGRKREEQYARLLKLFEEDDELELELGLRD